MTERARLHPKQLVPLKVRRLRPKLIAFVRRLRWLPWHLPAVTLEDLIADPAPSHSSDIILDDISMPPYSSSQFGDAATLQALIAWQQPRVVVELGTAYGNTVANICRLLPKVHVYTVNAPAERQSGILTTFDLGEQEIGRVYRKYGYADQVTQILENTLDLDLGDFLSGPVVDLAIIDACHDSEFVINDFHKTRPFIRPGGLVLFHDTHPSMERHYHTSYRACVQLRIQGYDIRHLTGTTWAIWFSGWPGGSSPGAFAVDEHTSK